MIWPAICACCGDASTVMLPPKRGLFRKQPTALAPYCAQCARHVQLWTAGSARANQIVGVGWGVGVIVYATTHTPVGSAVFAGSVLMSIGAVLRARTAARAALGTHCADAGPAVAQITGGFQFTSERYAVALAAENRDRLLSASPAIRQQLELPRAVVVTRKDNADS